MAQTISIQRGSVSFTARGDSTAGTSNVTTLFTNTSSGNGTRVIINYLTVQNPYVAGASDYNSARCSGVLGVVSSGTTGAIIGSMFTGQQTSTYQMPIGDPGIAAYGGTSIVSSPPRFRAGQSGNNQVGFTGTFPNNISFSAGDTTNGGYCPRTFWIGPSDVMKWWPQNSIYVTGSGKSITSNYYTQTLYYSFTCITES